MRLLFNYLSMKDSDPVASRSNKKAVKKGTPTNGDNCNTKITKFFSSFYNTSSNGNGSPRKTTDSARTDEQIKRKRGRPRKYDLNGRPLINGTTKINKLKSTSDASTSSSTASNSSSISSSTDVKPSVGRPRGRPRKDPQVAISNTKKKRKGNNKSSPKLRPRRRASQTYFFKYQLARNPLKAEEEDLKLALLASLQHCGGKPGKQRQQSCQDQELVETNGDEDNNNRTQNSQQHKQPKKENHSNHQQELPSKQQKQKHPSPKQTPTHTQDTVNLQQKTLPVYDEEYLKRYRPDTEDFLTFICFRITAPNHRNELSRPTASGSSADTAPNLIENELEDEPLNTCAATTSTGINVRISNDKSSTEYHNLRRSASPCKSSASNQTASNSSPNHLNSPSNRRRPIRQSPRLASSTNRKSSELEGLNNFTAYDNQITYEEDMKRAQMALDDMAMEINGPDDINELTPQVMGSNHRPQQNHDQNLLSKGTASSFDDGCTSPSGKSLSPYKNNKHFVENLMTRKFAGTFAESSEEIIFESIKNHKL